MSVFLAGLSALCYGAADYTGGRASRDSPVFGVLLLSQLTGLICISLVAPFISGTVIRLPDLLWGAAAGASGVLGLSLLYRALATSVAAIASPTAALVGAAAPVLAGAALGEQPDLTGWIGIALAIPAVLLLTAGRHKGEHRRRAFGLGLLAGLCFGGFFVLVSRTSPDSGLWPLAASKIAAIIIAFIVIRVSGSSWKVQPTDRLRSATAGVLDMAANVFFLLASRIGLLAISGVVSSLYPAPTVVLARVFDRQRLSVVRVIGLVLALGGVSLMTL